MSSLLPTTAAGSVETGSFPVEVAPGAAAHPLLAFLRDLEGGPELLGALPPLAWALTGLEPRPGAAVLLQATTDSGASPLLLVHRYGQGRVALFGGGPLWSWRFQPVGLGSGKEAAG